MGKTLSKTYTKTKEKITENPITTSLILGTSAIALSLYLFPPPKEMLLSRFLMLLKNDAVEECQVIGNTVFFRGISSDVWHQVNVSMISQDMLFKLICDKKDLIVSCAEPVDFGPWISIIGGKISFFSNFIFS